jgi:hypothetical protein
VERRLKIPPGNHNNLDRRGGWAGVNKKPQPVRAGVMRLGGRCGDWPKIMAGAGAFGFIRSIEDVATSKRADVLGMPTQP